MRIGFVTCVELGRACIDEALDCGGTFEVLVTLRDDLAVDKSGRVHLDEIAASQDTPLVKVRNINDPEAVDAIRSADLDWLFIVGWSQIAGPDVLSATRRGVLGMHPTLLPQGRGRASIPWAILKGLRETGVTLFKLDEGVDTGPILEQRHLAIEARETATSLYRKVSDAHVALMREVWPRLLDDSITPRPQDDSSASTWPGRRPEDGEFSFAESTTDEVDRLVRALTHPYPGASVRIDDRVFRVWRGEPSEDVDDPRTFPTKDGHYRLLETDPQLPINGA